MKKKRKARVHPLLRKEIIGATVSKYVKDRLAEESNQSDTVEAALIKYLKIKRPKGNDGGKRVSEANPLDRLVKRPILDVCCASRSMWFNKYHPSVIYGDIRSEVITVTDRSHKADGTRTLRIEPDTLIDFRDLPYPDDSFKLIAFDPPHLERAGPKSWMAAKYGKLSDDWREDLRAGFAECFRVLEHEGVLVFKWNETHVKVKEVLALAGAEPLFGQVSGRGGLTHWLVFMKGV